MKQNQKKYRRLALILGDQLFPNHSALEPDEETLFFMAEDYDLCTHFKYHKHKLILFLASMRSHANEIRTLGDLEYWKLEESNRNKSFEEKLEKAIETNNISEIVTYEVSDSFFRNRLLKLSEELNLKISFKSSPAFLTSQSDFTSYLGQVKKPFMHNFYQRQRKAMDLLLDEAGKPMHGKWSFDEDNRKKLPTKTYVPQRNVASSTVHTDNVIELVDQLFQDHPGDTKFFNWHTTREDVLNELQHFLEEKFSHFGPYEDAIEPEHTFMFHTTLSPYLNMGIITPRELVGNIISYAHENQIHHPSVEGLIRQIVGWREFVKGIYDNYEEKLQSNFFNHQNTMKKCWYNGTTGIKPLDDSINKAIQNGYTHHIERLMILGNFMLLCEIHPDEVHKWFMEMYVDSADWVMLPNVYGMSQFADGGIFATKPYIAGANYILKMSHYKKSEPWVETANGLYWRFIDRNRSLFQSNPRMSMMTSTLDKMDDQKRSNLFEKAETFISSVTNN